MVLVCALVCAAQWNINNRTSKPFISLLGETYELKTNKFRFIGECVCKVPSTLAFHAEGEGFEMTKTTQAKMKFTGT